MITSRIIANGIIRAVGILAAIYVMLYFLMEIQSVLIYLLISLIMTMIGIPIVAFLKRRLKFNNVLAVAVTLLLFLLVIAGFVMMSVPLILNQGKNLALLNTGEIEQNLTRLIMKIKVFLDDRNIDSSQLSTSNLTSKLNLNFIPNFFNAILGALSSFGVGLASVLFITFFFLKDRAIFFRGFKNVLLDEHADKILHSLTKINYLLSRYFIGLLLQLTVILTLYLAVLLLFGVKNAFVIAFLCAILNIIPYIGPLIGTVLAAILTMLSNIGSDFQSEILPTTIYVMIGFWAVQVIDNNFSGPLIFSTSVKSHPLEIFLVILIAGFLFGVVGMITAVPFYTILKVVGKEFFPDSRVIKLLTKNI